MENKASKALTDAEPRCPEGWVACPADAPCSRHKEYWERYLNRQPSAPATPRGTLAEAEPLQHFTPAEEALADAYDKAQTELVQARQQIEELKRERDDSHAVHCNSRQQRVGGPGCSCNYVPGYELRLAEQQLANLAKTLSLATIEVKLDRQQIEQMTKDRDAFTEQLREALDAPADRIWFNTGLLEVAKAKCQQVKELRQAANILIDYLEAHDWGLIPEPCDSINPLLKLLGR